MHHNLLFDEMISKIFNNVKNFDENGLVKDSIIYAFGLTCPNLCSGVSRGQCVKSNNFILIRVLF